MIKPSHLVFASFGTLFLHAVIAYILFVGSEALPKPILRELVVTNVTFLEEHKPEVIEQEIPQKPEPIVETKPPKSVKKLIAKPIALKEPIYETVATQAPSTEPIVESTVETKAVPKEPEHASVSVSHQSDDLISSYLAKVRHKIQESLRYSSVAKKMGLEGETVVQFFIHTNGMVDASSIKIAKTSGKAILDRNAVDAILEALPFDVPPKEDLEIVIPVAFKLKS